MKKIKLIIAPLSTLAVVPAIVTSCNKPTKVENFSITESGLVSLTSSAKELTEITIPAKVNDIQVKGIAGYGFKDSKVQTLKFESSDNITEIAFRAFNDCTSLKEFTIPKNLTVLGSEAFKGCTSLSTIKFEDGCKLEQLRDRTFEKCNISTITIPTSITLIAKSVFAGNKLTSVSFANTSNWKQTGGAAITVTNPTDNATKLKDCESKENPNWGYTGIECVKKANVDYSILEAKGFIISSKTTEVLQKEAWNILSFGAKAPVQAGGNFKVSVMNNTTLILSNVYKIEDDGVTSCSFTLTDWSKITNGATLTITIEKQA